MFKGIGRNLRRRRFFTKIALIITIKLAVNYYINVLTNAITPIRNTIINS